MSVKSGKPKCGSCATEDETLGVTSNAKPLDTTMAPSAYVTKEPECEVEAPSVADCTKEEIEKAPIASLKPCSAPTYCEEDHTVTITNNLFTTTVKATNSFNFPALGDDVELFLKDVVSLLPGAILVNPTIGRLHVQSFDPAIGKVIARNKDGTDCNNSPAGTLLPAMVEFLVDGPACGIAPTQGGSSNTNPFLAATFTAPGDSKCTTISVSTVNGLVINDIISINSFQYRISDVFNAETIEICDEGSGAPQGQTIEADSNCDGILDIPIIVISSDDPCSREAVNSGKLVVCKENVRSPISGTADGQVLKWSMANEEWVLANVNLEDNCVPLTVCLTVDANHAGPYIITVTNTSMFEVGEVVEVGSILFTIDAVVSSTELRVTANNPPGAITKFDVGTPVCEQDCCATLPDTVSDIQDQITNIENDITNINDTINDPCFPKQLLQVTPFPFLATQRLTFQPPADGPGGNFRRHFDVGDIHTDDFFNVTYNAPACNVYAEVDLQFNITMAVLGSDPDITDVFQFHDFVMGANGDFNSSEPRAFVHNKGGANFTHFLTGQGTQPPPASFALASYGFISGREHFTLKRGVTLAPSGSVQFQVGHRLSLSGPIQQVNWPGGTNVGRIEWALTGYGNLKVWKL